MRVRKGDKVIGLQEIEQAEAKKVRDDADMPPEIKAVTQMDAAIPVLGVMFP
jgi:hypothetical protein